MAITISVPGRIELLGNHTDYNGGRVIVAPTGRALIIRLAGTRDERITVSSEAFGGRVSQPAGSIRPLAGAGAWANQVFGVVALLQADLAEQGGLDLRIGGDLPVGAGLSSSAALGVATARAMLKLSRRRMSAIAIAGYAQRSENEFVGVPVGPLDLLSCAVGRPGRLTRFDFAGDEPRIEQLPMPRGWRLLIFDSGTTRALASSKYARRRRECAAAAKALGVSALGLVSPAQLGRRAGQLAPKLFRRARHVVMESTRVDEAWRNLLARRKRSGIGDLLNESQRSSQIDFENSHPAIDDLVTRLRRIPGVSGARLTGGGFGGAVIAWVRRGDTRHVLARLAAEGADAPRLLDLV